MAAFIAGFLLCIGLIVAIGAQNAFVLRQAIRGEHVLLVCLACALSDAVLISIGVAGFGAPGFEPADLRVVGVLLDQVGVAQPRLQRRDPPAEDMTLEERRLAVEGAVGAGQQH